MADRIDTSLVVQGLEKEFRTSKSPVTVNFRSMVPWLPYNARRFTHQLHSYPAKVIPQIPNFFLNCRSLVAKDAIVLDPFCGSGTIPLEACLSGHDCIVSDSNPLAQLLTAVKTTPISPAVMSKGISSLRDRVKAQRTADAPDVVNISYWYLPHVIQQLSKIAASTHDLPNGAFKQLCCVALSACARKASLADPRVSVPVRLNPSRYPKTHWLRDKTTEQLKRLRKVDAIDLFFQILNDLATEVASLWPVRSRFGKLIHTYSNAIGNGSNSLTEQEDASVDVIITSPPYLGAQKYVRATSLSLGWLSLARATELRALEDNSIGREHYRKGKIDEKLHSGISTADKILCQVRARNPLRAHIAAQYLREMQDAIKTCNRLLKPGGIFVLVSGANELCGHVFDTTAYLRVLCEREDLGVRFELTDSIQSRGLMTRRNKTAGLIPFESVTVLEKQ